MRVTWVVAVLVCVCGVARAQEQTTNPEELTRKYNDALAQLKAAQDRRNELATENERLTARIAELEIKLKESERREAEFQERTFSLRSHRAAWERFLRQHPVLMERWKRFIESSPLAAPSALPEITESMDPLAAP